MFIFSLLVSFVFASKVCAGGGASFGGPYVGTNITYSIRSDKASYHFRNDQQAGSFKTTPKYYGGNFLIGYGIVFNKNNYAAIEGFVHTPNYVHNFKQHKNIEVQPGYVVKDDAIAPCASPAIRDEPVAPAVPATHKVTYQHARGALIGAALKVGIISNDQHLVFIKFKGEISPSRHSIKTFNTNNAETFEQKNFNKVSVSLGIGIGYEYQFNKFRIGIGHNIIKSNNHDMKSNLLCINASYTLHQPYVSLIFPL